ncbi:MAG: GTP cyclohydrolase I [Bacilli bacterium]|nr:GTP cyclohydrolase I [Bacilli bacterium]
MKEKDLNKACRSLVENICKYSNIDKNDSNIKETPDRIYRMYKDELLIGYKRNPKDYIKLFDKKYNDKSIISIENIEVKSLCAHHLLPFFGEAKIELEYNENAKVLGLSKFYRIVDTFSRRLQLQENLTSEIANFLYDNLDIKWIKVELVATHTCVGLRGVNNTNNKTKTNVVIGEYNENN